MEKLNWDALKSMKCPKCDERISAMLFCKNPKCDFSIGQERFDEIVNKRYMSRSSFKANAFETNLGKLNNHGRKEMSEDFSDSPFLK